MNYSHKIALNKPVNTSPTDWREKFNKQFPCINASCDMEGTIINEDGEPEPCQYCCMDRMPYQSFIASEIASAIERTRKEHLGDFNAGYELATKHAIERAKHAITLEEARSLIIVQLSSSQSE